MEMKRPYIALLALFLLPSLAPAIYDWQRLDKNDLVTSVTNSGQLGQIRGGGGSCTYWPKPHIEGNGIPPLPMMNYVYGWGLWVGAQRRSSTAGKTRDTSVTTGYNPNNAASEFTPGAVIGGTPEDRNSEKARIFVSTEPGWPLKKANGQDSIISLCDTRCAYNDYLAAVHDSGGFPLKIEVTQTTYQWDFPAIKDAIYIFFEVKNTGSDTLYDVYLAPVADCDIGSESGSLANDVCYFDTTTNTAYQCQSESTEAGWARKPGCVGIGIIEGPVATKDCTLPDGRRILAGDTLGLMNFKVMNLTVNPAGNTGQYQAMAGYDYATGNYVPFDPLPAPGDQKFIASTGPFDIAPGKTARIMLCLICGNYDYSVPKHKKPAPKGKERKSPWNPKSI